MNVGAAFGGALGNGFPNAYLATRELDGWQTTPISPPTLQAPANSFAKISYAFSGDLSQTVLRVPLQQLTEGAPAGVYNLFLRGPSGSYSLVTAVAPPEPPAAACGACFETEDVPAYAGASSDFSHVIFEASDSLVPGAPGPRVENLYEAFAGQLSLVGILPDGTVPAQGATAGGGIQVVGERAHELAHAISRDGSHVLFEAHADSGGSDPKQSGMTELYDRIDASHTVEASAPGPGAGPEDCETAAAVCNAEPAQFWAASADGSVVYFTSRAALTKESFTGEESPSSENPGNDLYRYAVSTGMLTDLTVDHEAGDPSGADVLGVLGAAEDGSYVYFVAEGELGEPRSSQDSGKPNLYVWHEAAAGSGTSTYIATLAAPSAKEQENIELLHHGSGFDYSSDVGDWTSRPTESQAYVTPDGRHLAFMSVEPLTGYDNDDAATGAADHEVFEYGAEAGALACASCDPSGARPLGSAFIGAGLRELASTPFHQPRSVSDDGSRAFFTSPDPLVSGVSGGSEKVYEYEDGEPRVISGTEGGGSGAFLDASASGGDVFFATRERLAPGDLDELVDVYDARADGGLPASATLSPCQGGACQEPLSQPLFSTPVSATFVGTGNLPAPHPPTSRWTRKQMLARALAKCRRLTNRKQRSRCRTAANRRYAPVARKARSGRVATRRRSRG